MKKITLLASLALSVGLMTSCSVDDAMNSTTGNDNVAVQLDGNIGVTTRAAGTAWTANDKIGVFMVGVNKTLESSNILANAANVAYVTSAGDGKFSPVEAASTIYYPVEGSVDFYAYYPYSANVSELKYPIDVTDQNNQEALDLMYATAKNLNKKTPKAELQFEHQLCNVVFDVQPGEGLTESDLENMTITIEADNSKASFVLTYGLLSDENTPATITMKKKDGALTYEAILIPEDTNDNRKVHFNLNNVAGDSFEWTMTGNLKGGKKYHYTKVKVTRTGAEVSGTIKDWTPVADDTEYEAK